jgi:superfamily II RNA helicase
MVQIVSEYTYDNDDKYGNYFSSFPFELSIWQKHSIQGIVDNKNVLVCAPTGSGKTLPAMFAITYFTKLGLKVIYTSPIKALSNQKFYDFNQEFGHLGISFGILTGDNKENPEADVLIMTTEILRNNLYQKQFEEKTRVLDFDIDMNKVGIIIFDEVHYINDKDRGTVWEESMMLIPKNISMLMLSATIDKPENFAQWVENIHGKEVILASTYLRHVPLKHYIWYNINSHVLKQIKDKTYKETLNQFCGTPHLLSHKKKIFVEDTFNKLRQHKTFVDKINSYITKSHVLNNVTTYLKENELLPAIYFVFSRVNVEKFAKEIGFTLFEEGSNLPSIIRKECIKILRKLPNYEEYIHLPEFEMIVSLLEKGIAIHHAGLLQVFREMIELVFTKGFIKVLFATETFAVGINMPTKTVVFTSLEKFDGSEKRYLLPHEYTQLSERAGRRGFDTVGTVIHLNNFFNLPSTNEYKTLLGGKSPSLISKFKISYNMVLNTHLISEFDAYKFVGNSILQNDLKGQANGQEESLHKLEEAIVNKEASLASLRTPRNIIETYLQKTASLSSLKNKQRKKMEIDLGNMEYEYRHLKQDVVSYKNYESLIQNKKSEKEVLSQTNNFIKSNIEKVNQILTMSGFLNEDETLTEKGIVAANIKEGHCLALADCIVDSKYMAEFEPVDIACILSCMTNIRVQDEFKSVVPNMLNDKVNQFVLKLQKNMNNFNDMESRMNIWTGIDDELHFDLMCYVYDWCFCEDETSCKLIIQKMNLEKGIFLGEFTKALLKITNLCDEIEKICTNTNYVDLMHKCTTIKGLLLKFVATNQSLYL